MQKHTSIRPIAFLLAVIALSALVGATAAHDIKVVKATPADREVLEESPTQVIVQFDYELIGDKSFLKVFDANGNQVDNGDSGLDLNDPKPRHLDCESAPVAGRRLHRSMARLYHR